MAPRLGSHRKGFRWRRLYIALVAVPAIPIIFLFGGYFWIHGSLESYENILTVPGIERPVEIVRDKFAIPHIYAHSERDAAFAMGFVHAQDRLWQMELQRRIGAGRLSEIFGERGLATDRFLRTLGIYDISEQNLKHLSGSAQDLYESYSAGVNTYLQNRSGPLPPGSSAPARPSLFVSSPSTMCPRSRPGHWTMAAGRSTRAYRIRPRPRGTGN